MNDNLKPQKRLIEFSRYATPVERHYRLGERTLTLTVYAEGKRTFESKWDVARRGDDDGLYSVDEPTVYYVALARVAYDSAGQLEPGRFIRVKAFECEELGFGDTEHFHVKPRPGETFPKASRILT